VLQATSSGNLEQLQNSLPMWFQKIFANILHWTLYNIPYPSPDTYLRFYFHISAHGHIARSYPSHPNTSSRYRQRR